MHDFVFHYYPNKVMVITTTRKGQVWAKRHLGEEDVCQVPINQILFLKSRMQIDGMLIEETRE